jgi:hypothetical protein
MSSWRFLLSVCVAALAVCATLIQSDAQQPKKEAKEAPAAKEPDPKIVPVVLVKPGETKELLMSTWCHLGITRGGGLSVKMMKGGSFDGEADNNDRFSKVWKLAGITVEVPDFGEAEKAAALPVYAPLKEKGINAFVVKVTAAEDAKPGLLNLHLADSTCSGNCASDFRVLVVAPKK